MADEPVCPRCGAPIRAGDGLCRRCGTDLPAAPSQVIGSVQRALGNLPEPFSLPWLLGGVVVYLVLLFLGFQLFRDVFAEFLPTLQSLMGTPTDATVRANAGTLSDLFLKIFVLVGASYLLGGILLGRASRGRVRTQAAVAAGLSWSLLAMRAAVLPAPGSLHLQLVLGGLAVVAVASLGAWFGYWLRPKA